MIAVQVLQTTTVGCPAGWLHDGDPSTERANERNIAVYAMYAGRANNLRDCSLLSTRRPQLALRPRATTPHMPWRTCSAEAGAAPLATAGIPWALARGGRARDIARAAARTASVAAWTAAEDCRQAA